MGRMTHMQSSHSVCSTSKLLSMLCPQPGHSAIGMPAATCTIALISHARARLARYVREGCECRLCAYPRGVRSRVCVKDSHRENRDNRRSSLTRQKLKTCPLSGLRFADIRINRINTIYLRA